MADLSKIKLNGVEYNIKDAEARTNITNLQNQVGIIDLGEIELANYEDDYDVFFSTLTDTGTYRILFDDGIEVICNVKRSERLIWQEYSSTDEYSVIYYRTGAITNNDRIDWMDWKCIVDSDSLDSTIANHVHYTVDSTSYSIRQYLNAVPIQTINSKLSQHKIIRCTADNTMYNTYTFASSYLIQSYYQLSQMYFSYTDPSIIYVRSGKKSSGGTVTWDDWQEITSNNNSSMITYLDSICLSDYEEEDSEDSLFNFLATLTEPGIYVVFEEDNGFSYHITVERNGDAIATSWWTTEEGKYATSTIEGYIGNNNIVTWSTDIPYSYLTTDIAQEIFAKKNHIHYTTKTTNLNIKNYIATLPGNELHYRTTCTLNNHVYDIQQDIAPIGNQWLKCVRYIDLNEPDKVYMRSSIKTGGPGAYTDGDWQVYQANLSDVAISGDYNDLDNVPDLATESVDGLLSAYDKKILNDLNPNIEKTISNLNASEFNIINAKQNNALGLVMAVEPTISQQIRTINLLDVSVYTPGFYIGSNGQLSSNTNDHVGDFIPVSPGDDIYYTGIIGPTNSSSINRRLHVYTANQTWIKQISFASSLKVGDSWSTHGVVPANGAYVRVSWGVEDTNVMITVGAPDKYYPYYMTPFTATNSVNFKVGPTSDPEDATTYTFNVPAAAGNLYGLKFDPIKGKLWKITEHIASYNGETLPGYWQSDRDVYIEGNTPQVGAEVVYWLDNEDIEEYTCSQMVIPLNYHENYFFIENGMFLELSYYAATIAMDHLTIYSGMTFGSTNILETDVIGWNRAAGLIDTKADLVGAQLTGAVTAPTLNIIANSDRIATTAFVQQMLHTLAPFETTVKASKNYEIGEYLTYAGNLYKVTAAIAKNANLTVGTNIEATDVATELNLLRSLIQT